MIMSRRCKASSSRKSKRTCVICSEECEGGGSASLRTRSIVCSGCLRWVHERCTPMSANEFNSFATSDVDFLSLRCVFDDSCDECDYGKSLNRYKCFNVSVFS